MSSLHWRSVSIIGFQFSAGHAVPAAVTTQTEGADGKRPEAGEAGYGGPSWPTGTAGTRKGRRTVRARPAGVRGGRPWSRARPSTPRPSVERSSGKTRKRESLSE